MSSPIKSAPTVETEVLIVGSGFGAAPPALRMAEAGLRVLVLEKGPDVIPERDFRETQDVKYLQRFARQYDGEGIGFTTIEALGGGSGMYLAMSMRAPGLIFKQMDHQNRPFWPKDMSRAALDPHYVTAEKMLQVRQVQPKEISKNAQIFERMMHDQGQSSDRIPMAIGENCVKCGFCVSGCRYGAKHSLHTNYIRQAKAKGVTYRTGVNVLGLRKIEGQAPFRYEADCESTAADGSKSKFVVRARVVVSAGGTVGSGRLLMNSRENLGELSPMLGERVIANAFFFTVALLPEGSPDAQLYRGTGIPGNVTFDFLESHKLMLLPYKALPIQLLIRSRLSVDDGKGGKAYWGPAHVKMMQEYAKRGFILAGIRFLSDYASMKVDSAGKVKLKLEGSPTLESEAAEVRGIIDGVLRKAGCEVISTELADWKGQPFEEGLHFNSTHPAGSCRMGDTIENGVVDSHGEVFGNEGLFVTDAAVIPSSLIVPPSLTILAIAERACGRILERVRST